MPCGSCSEQPFTGTPYVRRKRRLHELAIQFVVAICGGLADGMMIANRRNTCKKCIFLSKVTSKNYCPMCGCPKWWLSRLSVKVRLKRATCPMGMWPTINGRSIGVPIDG